MTNWTEEEVYLVAERAREWALQGYLDEAAILFAGLVAAAPGYPYARRSLAAIRLHQGRPAEAWPLLDAEAHELRMETLLALGRPQDAESELAAARGRLDPAVELRWRWRLETARQGATFGGQAR